MTYSEQLKLKILKLSVKLKVQDIIHLKGEIFLNKRAHIIMRSDVDGVGFRFLVKQKAQSLGLKGQCKQNNEKDIMIDIEGNTNSMEEFIQFIQKGVSPFMKNNSFEIEFFDDLIGYTTMETDIV